MNTEYRTRALVTVGNDWYSWALVHSTEAFERGPFYSDISDQLGATVGPHPPPGVVYMHPIPLTAL